MVFFADIFSVTTMLANESYQEKAIKSLGRLPPFSLVLNRLLATLGNEDVSFAKLAMLIEKDTVLAGNVLRMVNSALYGRRGTINSVGHAIAIMGLIKLRNTALSFAVSRMWKNVRTPRGWSSARFNLHSLATAILSDHLVQHVPVSYPEGAFAAGLFHDLGKLLIATVSVDDSENILRLTSGPEASRTSEECELELLGCSHAELSALALQHWNLPDPVHLAVRFHHHAEQSPPEAYGSFTYTLAHVVQAADETVKHLGITIRAVDADQETTLEFPALKRIGLEEKIPVILANFESEFATLKSAA